MRTWIMPLIALLMWLGTAAFAADQDQATISGYIHKISGLNVTVQPVALTAEIPPEVVVSTNEKTKVTGLSQNLDMTVTDLKVGMEVQVILDDKGNAEQFIIIKPSSRTRSGERRGW